MDAREAHRTRRGCLQTLALLGAGIIASGCAAASAGRGASSQRRDRDHEPEGEDEVSPAEDLMREHGVLKRVLLIYGEGIRRLEADTDLPLDAIVNAAGIIRTFIEDYHEKLEEEFLFPRFRQANVHVDLVAVLGIQHQAGRRLTDQIVHLARTGRDSSARPRLRHALGAFVRMYEPHEAREDTVLFPALRTIVTRHEYDALGEEFEKKEHDLFGEDGFERMVERVAALEKELKIYDLAQFTPPL